MILLSVIIPTRNRAKTLSLTLTSIANQSLPKELYEVIVVDNGSSDGTAAVCAGAACTLPNLVRFYDERPGLHVGRNLGLEKGRADLLVYADDDIEAFPEWLEAIVAAFSYSRVALVGGRNIPKFEVAPPRWLIRRWRPNFATERRCGPLSIIDLGELPRLVSPYDIYGCNFSVRRSVLLAARGFHPDGVPSSLIQFRGDGETHVSQFVERAGLLAYYHPKASVLHLVPRERMTVRYFCRRWYNQGVSDSYTQVRLSGGQGRQRRAAVGSGFKKIAGAVVRPACRFRLLGTLFAGAWARGYMMHQKRVREDSTVRDWCLRDDYLSTNATLPEIE